MIARRPHPQSPARRSQHGSALISTLLVLLVLTIIVVAFLQSMAIERETARSYKNRFQAELAANAGAKVAISQITSFISSNPYYASGVWSSSTPTPGKAWLPVLVGANTTNPTATDVKTIYLVSNNSTSSLPPTSLTTNNSIDVNIRSSLSDESGWMGSPSVSGSQTHLEHRAPWVILLANPSSPNQPDPNKPNYNPVIARYAYWVEDETMKLDSFAAGNANGAGGSFLRSAAGNSTSDLDLGALPLSGKAPLSDGDASLSEWINLREQNPNLPRDGSALAKFTDAPKDDFKFHSTSFSLSNELAGNGRRRANVNHIVTNSRYPSDIAGDLDDIIFVITGSRLSQRYPSSLSPTSSTVYGSAPTETNPLPNFGRRFYTNPPFPNVASLSDDHAAMYLLKLAANIRDYIDTDAQPTVLTDPDGFGAKIISQTRPSVAWATGLEPIAIGKESSPLLSEYAYRLKMLNVSVIPDGPGNVAAERNRRSVTFLLDHYFEFYNPTTKSYTAPEGTELKIYDQAPLARGTFTRFLPPDYTMDISGTVFPAGSTIVITSCQQINDDPEGMMRPGAVVIRPFVAARNRQFTLTGNEPVSRGGGVRYGIQLDGRANPPSTLSDYATKLLVTTPDGYLDAHPALAIAGSTTSVVEMTLGAGGSGGSWSRPPTLRDKLLVWSSTPRGNDVASRSADVRSVNEPMMIVAGTASLGNDQYRFFSNIIGDGNIPSTSTWGLPNSRPLNTFTVPTNWPDYHPLLTNGANNTYAVVSNSPMKSIGELGMIYDPHRKFSSESGASILTARGGGRTLKIGQPDDTMPGAQRYSSANSTSVGWNNAAWRLTDYFCALPQTVPVQDPTTRGKINLNGVLRDNGVALRAALRQFRFSSSPEGDPLRSNQLLTESEINILISQLTDYLRTKGPMMERGELSELRFFASTDRAGNTPSNTSMDRSREEIFRRIVEIITVRSLSFSVYAIGQSILQRPNGDLLVTGTSANRYVYWLSPTIGDQVEAKATSYTANEVYRVSR